MNQIRVIVAGAAGRMGKRLVYFVMNSSDMKLVGATEYLQSPFIGKDAGLVAGCEPAGVIIGAELEPFLKNADILIDFSTGNTIENAKLATNARVGVVIGTTAISEEGKKEIKKMAESGGKIVMSSNMSAGVNILLDLCRKTANILGNDADVEIVEVHHNKKKDAPSGTAYMLAEAVAKGKDLNLKENAVYGRNGIVGERKKSEIGIHAVRGGDVVGDHTVIFACEGERIELVHKASSRDTFANGAIRAARFLNNATSGLYSMKDVLNL